MSWDGGRLGVDTDVVTAAGYDESAIVDTTTSLRSAIGTDG